MSVAASISDAANDMLALFTGVWAGKPCDFPGSGFTAPAITASWARWRLQHNTGGQGSLADVAGKRRFVREGTVFIQIFTPLNAGVEIAYGYAENVVGAYEGKRTASGAWFRNARINEVEASENTAFMQINVLIDFEYDQIH